jgi:hypothetical protein
MMLDGNYILFCMGKLPESFCSHPGSLLHKLLMLYLMVKKAKSRILGRIRSPCRNKRKMSEN